MKQFREEAPRDLKYFESKFEARIEDSREYRQHVSRPFYDWNGETPFENTIQVVPMKAIHLSSDNLERLMREQDLMDKLMNDAEYGKKLWRQQIADNAVRESNTAVDKAYRNYQMLLELARK